MTSVRRAMAVVGALGLVFAALVFDTGASAGRSRGLIAVVKDTEGDRLGTARFVRRDDGKISVRAALAGLTPGWHGFHVHTTGICDPAATDTGGSPSPFFTAGGHYNPDTTMTHGGHAGDMPPLLVAEDGTASLRFVTDRFTLRELRADDGSAVIVHASADNLAHIPATTSTGAERYHSHVDDVFGPDTATKATGDAGSRFGCGVVRRVSS
jgi:Cu-Zn family superoxide dismutase